MQRYFSNKVSQLLSAIHRQLINGNRNLSKYCLHIPAARTATVWAVGLFLYYRVNDQLGESWSIYSLLQLAVIACKLTSLFSSDYLLFYIFV